MNLALIAGMLLACSVATHACPCRPANITRHGLDCPAGQLGLLYSSLGRAHGRGCLARQPLPRGAHGSVATAIRVAAAQSA